MSKIKVIIVDDHPVVREGLRQLLGTDANIEVIAEAGSGLECLRLLEKSSPDIIFMDISMPGISGIDSTRLICQKYPHIKVIVLTIYEDDQFVAEAVRAGAKGYVLKKVQRDELIKVIHHVMEEKAFLDPGITASVFRRLKGESRGNISEEKPDLTQRELEVLKGIVAGQKDIEIAENLFISQHTVRSHIKNLYKKLGVSSRTKAAAIAIRHKIIQEKS